LIKKTTIYMFRNPCQVFQRGLQVSHRCATCTDWLTHLRFIAYTNNNKDDSAVPLAKYILTNDTKFINQEHANYKPHQTSKVYEYIIN